MNRRAFLLSLCAAATLAATPACADFVGTLQVQLQKQGFRQVSVSKTLLGRARIIAHAKSGSREIIMNPRTGEILRDQWTATKSTAGSTAAKSNDNKKGDSSASSGSGSGGDDGGNNDGGDDHGGDDGGESGGGESGGHDHGGDGEGGDGGEGGGDD